MPNKRLPTEVIRKTILTHMVQAHGNFLSGSKLAQELNISRVSIREHLKKLQEDGFTFEAIRNRGYRITELPKTLHPDLIQAYLKTLNTPNVSFLFFNELDSTNSQAERELSQNTPTPIVVLAKTMTQGRGRHGRTWYSQSLGNLYITFAFQPNLPPHAIPSISLWFATQICHLLNETFHLPVQIKWPNDLVCKGKKVCGMLTESRIDRDHTRDIVFGVGLNISGNTHSWPSELQEKASTLEATSKETLNINLISAHLIHHTLQAYEHFIHHKYLNELQTLWKHYDSLHGKHIRGYIGETPIEGIALGIDDNGALKVQSPTGHIQHLQSSEISLSQPF